MFLFIRNDVYYVFSHMFIRYVYKHSDLRVRLLLTSIFLVGLGFVFPDSGGRKKLGADKTPSFFERESPRRLTLP